MTIATLYASVSQGWMQLELFGTCGILSAGACMNAGYVRFTPGHAELEAAAHRTAYISTGRRMRKSKYATVLAALAVAQRSLSVLGTARRAVRHSFIVLKYRLSAARALKRKPLPGRQLPSVSLISPLENDL